MCSLCVHTGNKVEFNTVDFGPIETSNKIERTFNILATKLTVSATMLKLHEY